MKNLSSTTSKIIKLFKNKDFFVFLGITSAEDYVYHNNISTVIIDSTGLKLYNEPTEFTQKQLNKQLIEFLLVEIPETKDIIIKIESSFITSAEDVE